MNLKNVFTRLRNHDTSRAPRREAALQPRLATLGAMPFGLPRLSGTRRRSTHRDPEKLSIVSSCSAGARAVVLAVQEPRVRTTKWHLGGHHHDRVLSMPWMIFFICFFRGGFERLYVFFLKERYSGRLTLLYHSILPNSDNSGWVCMGTGATRDSITRATLRHTSPDAKVASVLTAFWQGSHFNEDFMERFTQHAPFLHLDLSSIAAWERASRRRPGFIHAVPWQLATTAGAVTDQLRRNR